MKVKHVWDVVNTKVRYDDWELTGDEQELVAAAYDRKEKLRGEEHWMSVNDVFHLFTDEDEFIYEFSL
jgi:hypothetical protein